MIRIFLLLFILSVNSFLFGQTLGVRWSRPLGGSNQDYGNDIQKTTDGGFLFAGSTWSNDGNVSGNHDSTDIWVVKLNKFGAIEWQKCFGGTGDETFRKLLYNADGTAVIIGVTNTNNNGDITGKPNGSYDLWVIKIDAFGNILWKKTLGGSLFEEFRYADFTSDNGYIITGYTTSNDGDVTGNHGGEDIWVVKLSGAGNIEWQKTLGGSASDRPRFIVQDKNGNYVMVGSTASSDGDVTNLHGSNDLWVVKLSSAGTIVWQRPYGGTNSDTGFKGVFASDGSLSVLANTTSIDGNVVGRSSTLDVDTWIVNVDYNTGNINWQKCIGGAGNETPVNIFKDADDMFLVSSYTNSKDGVAITNHGNQDVLLTKLSNNGSVSWAKCFGGPSEEILRDIYNDTASRNYVFVATASKGGGDIVNYHQNPNYLGDSTYDAWVVKVKYDGSIDWQRCIGGTRNDYLYSVRKVSENVFVLAGESQSNDGDVQLPHSYQDAWAVELALTNTVKGTVFIDKNSNGIKDASDPFYTGARVATRKPSDSIVSLSYNGYFANEVDTGSYSTSAIVPIPYFNVVPAAKTANFSTYFNTDSFSFALQPIPNKQDLAISVFPVTSARPGFAAAYRLVYKNIGTTTIPSGEIAFKKDGRVNVNSASPTVSSISGDTLKWSYSNFNPGDSASILLSLQVPAPPIVNINDTLSFTAVINPAANDETPANDTAILQQRVLGSYDPNDKSESNAGSIPLSFVTNGNYLQYTIRFQNTGTDTAFNIVVRDTLSNRLDANTLEVVAASHPYSLSITNGVNLAWRFDNIHLPDSNKNEPASHGYIVYRIRPKSDLAKGEIVHNTASIYFDYNLPVVTNDATTQVQTTLVTLPQGLLHFYGSQQGSQVNLFWEVTEGTELNHFEIEKSNDGKTFYLIGNALVTANTSSYRFADKQAMQAVVYYRLKLVQASGGFRYSPVLMFQNKPGGATDLLVYPNPLTTQGYAAFFSNAEGKAELELFSPAGLLISMEAVAVAKGQNVFAIGRTPQMAPGQYLLRLVANGQAKVRAFVVQ